MLILGTNFFAGNEFYHRKASIRSLLKFNEYCNSPVHYYLSTYFSIVVPLSPQTFTLAVLVLYLKKEEDILQGINKLDFLLKVSIFQIFKIRAEEELKS